jgi:hypothetical protein
MPKGSFSSFTHRPGHGPHYLRGDHQIPLAKEDQPITAFFTPFGCFCYAKMPFGLKNVEATYQQCMQSCFREQIRCNLEVYIDDIIIKLGRR